MKKVLGIIGSPRKLGNCELMVKEIARHLPNDFQLELLRLSDLHLEPCSGCYRCLFAKRCVHRDDLHIALNALVAADAIIVAIPTYFLGPNGALKLFLDRGMALYSRIEELWGTPAIGIAIAGIEGKEGYTQLAVQSFLKLALADIRATAVLYGALPGEIFDDPRTVPRAQALAAALAAPQVPATAPETQALSAPRCNLCGGDSFRFLDQNTVQCLLCSNRGKVSSSHGAIAVDIAPTAHDFFLSLDQAVAHREWLKGMKTRFRNHLLRLKEVTQAYAEDGKWISGEWISPEKP